MKTRHVVAISAICVGSAIVAFGLLQVRRSDTAHGRRARDDGEPSGSSGATPDTTAGRASAAQSMDLEVVIRATVMRMGHVSRGESIDATATSSIALRPGWCVRLRVDECLRGELGLKELTILVSHSPSSELGIPAVGGQVVLRLCRAQSPVALYSYTPETVFQVPDVSAVKYSVSRPKYRYP
jgi:hypothetical protein